VIRVLFVKKIASKLTRIDTNIKRVQIRRICPFALFLNTGEYWNAAIIGWNVLEQIGTC